MIYIILMHMTFNIIKMKYECGPQKGTCYGPDILEKQFDYERVHEIKAKNIRDNLGEGFMQSLAVHDSKRFPLVIGSEPINSISSIFASNTYCVKKGERLGVVWCSPVKEDIFLYNNFMDNIVEILCGYKCPEFWFGTFLTRSQFIYYNACGSNSKKNDNSNISELNDITFCLETYDKVHIVFDTTHVDDNNKSFYTYETLKKQFINIKKTKKMISLDIIGFNPIISRDTYEISNLVKLFLLYKNS